MRAALTAVTCFSWHLDEGTLDSRVESRVLMLLKIDSSSELSICRGVVDWGGWGCFLFGRTGENRAMRATKPFSLSERVVWKFVNNSGIR